MNVNMKKILFICGGNTCRSPMAKVILEQKLKANGKEGTFVVDSAAYDGPTHPGASVNAREAMKTMFGADLLAGHAAKKRTPELAEKADLILVMAGRMKEELPPGKTWTLKEYAGKAGDVADPFNGDKGVYLACAHEIAAAIDLIVPKLTGEWAGISLHKGRRLLAGIPAAPGVVAGIVRNVGEHSPELITRIKPGEVVVSKHLHVDHRDSLRKCAGFVTEVGGKASNTAIMARGLYAPAVTEASMATSVLKDGQRVVVDGCEGAIYEYREKARSRPLAPFVSPVPARMAKERAKNKLSDRLEREGKPASVVALLRSKGL